MKSRTIVLLVLAAVIGVFLLAGLSRTGPGRRALAPHHTWAGR